MVPVLLKIGPLTIYSFGAMMALGFLIAGYVVSVELGRKGFDPEDAWSIVLWGAVGGIVGARLLAILADWQTFRVHPIELALLRIGIRLVRRPDRRLRVGQHIRRAPLDSAGSRRSTRSPRRWRSARRSAGSAARWRATATGEGRRRMPWGVQYPRAIVGWAAWLRDSGLAPDTRVHPAPVYETLAYSAIFCLLWSLRKKRTARRFADVDLPRDLEHRPLHDRDRSRRAGARRRPDTSPVDRDRALRGRCLAPSLAAPANRGVGMTGRSLRILTVVGLAFVRAVDGLACAGAPARSAERSCCPTFRERWCAWMTYAARSCC